MASSAGNFPAARALAGSRGFCGNLGGSFRHAARWRGSRRGLAGSGGLGCDGNSPRRPAADPQGTDAPQQVRAQSCWAARGRASDCRERGHCVCGDGVFNVRRLERYLAQCWESGAKSIVVLNKADNREDVAARIAEVECIAAGIPIFSMSARTGDGVDALDSFLAPGQTIVLLGSSGVGKSTLVNHFLRRDAQAVQAGRVSDSRGRHTTTTRELFALPGGALLIDTPGLRELQLWGAREGVERTFSDIEEMAAQCRYGNCGHTTEPGCAVQTAIAEGRLDEERVESWRKLEREQEFLRRKIDPEAQKQEKERVKLVHRGARQKYDQRRKDGGKP